MHRASARRTITIILLSAALVFAGNGLLQIVLPLRAELEAFTTSEIGVLGTAYFAGLTAGCLWGPLLIRDVGHVRAYAGTVAMLTALIVALPLFPLPFAWIGLRFLTGVCLAVNFMALESWLNDRATNANRGRVLSLYLIVTNVGWILGQLGVNLADLQDVALFLYATVAICLSAALVALTPTAEPDAVPEVRLDLPGLFRLSPIGTIGCVLVGTAEGAFWSLGPLFGRQSGMSVFEVTLLMGAFVLGGTLAQWPIGRLSDRYDRRLVILPVSLAAVFTGVAIILAADRSVGATLAVALLHGALMIPIYSLCLAHVNDNAPAERFVQVSGGLLLIYSFGASIGPLATAPLMERFGAGALFLVISGLLGSFGLLIVYRLISARARRRLYPAPYAPASRTTQAAYEMEP